LKRDGLCIFCGKFSGLVIGWWAIGIDMCHPCNKARQDLALQRVRESLEMEKVE